jgi:hypothetical protein
VNAAHSSKSWNRVMKLWNRKIVQMKYHKKYFLFVVLLGLAGFLFVNSGPPASSLVTVREDAAESEREPRDFYFPAKLLEHQKVKSQLHGIFSREIDLEDICSHSTFKNGKLSCFEWHACVGIQTPTNKFIMMVT